MLNDRRKEARTGLAVGALLGRSGSRTFEKCELRQLQNADHVEMLYGEEQPLLDR